MIRCIYELQVLPERIKATHVVCFHEGMPAQDVMCYTQILQQTPCTLGVVFIGWREYSKPMAALGFSLVRQGHAYMAGMWQE